MLEIALASALLLIMFGSYRMEYRSGIFWDIIISASFMFLFYIISGFIFSCLIFGYVYRNPNLCIQAIIMSSAFLLHAAGFLLISGEYFSLNGTILLPVGVCIVAFTSALGTILNRNHGDVELR